MVIAPCSMRTLAAVAHGLADNLITRAADVMLKERRRLVLMVRETPLNLAHLRNMVSVTEMGAIVCPPVPAFYQRPQTVAEIVDHSVARVLDLLDLPARPGAALGRAGHRTAERLTMAYHDLRDFMAQLEAGGRAAARDRSRCRRYLEMTALCDRVLRAGGPALLFEQPTGHSMPVLGNLFGTTAPRGARHGRDRRARAAAVRRAAGHPQGARGAQGLQGHAGHGQPAQDAVAHGAQGWRSSAPCQEVVWEGADVDLARLPVQHCWPGDVAPLITWGLVITHGPHKARQNLGIYRQQVLSRNQVIMRWLAHRGGAQDFRDHGIAHPGQPYPVAVALGADPATILGAVTPVPDSLSRIPVRRPAARQPHRGGRGAGQRAAACRPRPRSCSKATSTRCRRTRAATSTRWKARSATTPATTTSRPSFRCSPSTASRMRRDPIYHSTYTGKPPDEPAVLALALNELFVPLLQRQFPEITDFYLPPEGCSYRMALVQHHARPTPATRGA